MADLNISPGKIKLLVIPLILMGAFFLIFFGVLEVTGRPGLCASCHMMKPEYYTWQASSHKKVKCVACHARPGLVNAVKFRIEMAKKIYAAAAKTYYSPIVLLKPVSDKACNRCHNINTRVINPSGDLIIPHEVHAKENVGCYKCHRGVAHGSISDRKVTYRSDYYKWDGSLGAALMKDEQFVQPDMDSCVRCHQVRKAPLDCKACHNTSQLPEDHRSKEFKSGLHGKAATSNLKSCDLCHRYMSTQKAEGIKEEKKYMEFLEKSKSKKNSDSVGAYSRTNSFCKTCHEKKPPSHKDSLFIENHGLQANKDMNRCMICHDNRASTGPSKSRSKAGPGIATKSCGACHPSIHNDSVQWKSGYHPVELPEHPRITATCYKCHLQELCAKCHGGLR